MMYFVSWYIHNSAENVWNGMIVDQFSDLMAAKKEYHRQLAMYINEENFDRGSVMLTDSLGNRVMSEFWQAAEEDTED